MASVTIVRYTVFEWAGPSDFWGHSGIVQRLQGMKEAGEFVPDGLIVDPESDFPSVDLPLVLGWFLGYDDAFYSYIGERTRVNVLGREVDGQGFVGGFGLEFMQLDPREDFDFVLDEYGSDLGDVMGEEDFDFFVDSLVRRHRSDPEERFVGVDGTKMSSGLAVMGLEWVQTYGGYWDPPEHDPYCFLVGFVTGSGLNKTGDKIEVTFEDIRPKGVTS